MVGFIHISIVALDSQGFQHLAEFLKHSISKATKLVTIEQL